MAWIEAFDKTEDIYRQQVLKETWGHLAPKKNTTYRGMIVFAVGIFGDDELNPVPIKCELKNHKGEELDSSPWFYDALAEMLSGWATDGRYGHERQLPNNWPRIESGGVYEWVGSFRNYEFAGELRQLKLTWTRHKNWSKQ